MRVARWIVLPLLTLLPKALYELGFFEGIVRIGQNNLPDISDDFLSCPEQILHEAEPLKEPLKQKLILPR